MADVEEGGLNGGTQRGRGSRGRRGIRGGRAGARSGRGSRGGRGTRGGCRAHTPGRLQEDAPRAPNWESYDEEDAAEDGTNVTTPVRRTKATPAGWVPPPIVPVLRSPVLLRRRDEDGRVQATPHPHGPMNLGSGGSNFGTSEDPILLEADSTDDGDRVLGDTEAGFDTDDDLAILESAEQHTPVRPRVQGRSGGRAGVGAAICRFSIQDFTPGAPAPNPYLRQALGDYLPWLHDCGEVTCPFTEPSSTMYEESLTTGTPLPNSTLSPGNKIRVDKRAFTDDVYVKVPLDVLGYDRGLWGDLECFGGVVVERYYQEVTGSPMFGVDFGGSIGRREVNVCDSLLDNSKGLGGSTQRVLDFGDTGGSNGESVAIVRGEGSSQSMPEEGILNPLNPRAPLLSDSDHDLDWMGDFEDFPPEHDDVNMMFDEDALMEDPMAELGIYNDEEDTSNWTFEEVYDDSQWQEQQMTLLGGPRRFTGPLPGSIHRGDARRGTDCRQYFDRFWSDEVLQRIVDETNR